MLTACNFFPMLNMCVARCVNCLLAIALALGSSGALSEVYRWKDSSGTVHFGDRPDSTNPGVAKEVVVPSPNLATGFKGVPPTSADGQNKAVSNGKITTPAGQVGAAAAPTSTTAPKRGIAAQSKDSCQAKVEAFRASTECFGACGSTNGSLGRNNAGCQHCVDQPMPNC